jgi:hypothetical protein
LEVNFPGFSNSLELARYLDNIIESKPVQFVPITARPDIFQPHGTNQDSNEKMSQDDESPNSYINKKGPMDKTNRIRLEGDVVHN